MVWGERVYAMRVWLDPEKLASLGLTAADVYDAVTEQNQQVAAGAIGAPPTAENQKFQLTLTAKGRLKSQEEFENIVLGVGPDSAVIRLKDVARVELGAEDYTFSSTLNSGPTVGLGIMQLPGANALQLSAEVRATMAELAQDFPEGLNIRSSMTPRSSTARRSATSSSLWGRPSCWWFSSSLFSYPICGRHSFR